MNYVLLDMHQIGFIMGINTKEARKKMIIAFDRQKGTNVPTDLFGADYTNSYLNEKQYPKVIRSDWFDKQLNLEVTTAALSIKNSFMKTEKTLNMIMHFPYKKIQTAARGKNKSAVKRIQIPLGLYKLLPREDCDFILNEWINKLSKMGMIFVRKEKDYFAIYKK